MLLAGDIALNPGPQTNIKLAFTNIRSIKNKSTSVSHFLSGHNIDIFAITETWLRNDDTSSLLSEITPAGYQLYHRPREDRRGGGVGFLVNCNISCKELPPVKEFESFEFILLHVALPDRSIHIACIYRPPGTDQYFLQHFSDLLSYLNSLKQDFIIVGDINIDPNTHCLANRYNSILEEYELKQHVDFLTHLQGRTLDHLITPISSSLVKSVKISDCLSDHMVISAELNTIQTAPEKKTIWFRKFHKINRVQLCSDLKSSDLVKNPTSSSCAALYKKYHDTLSSLLDKHAPLRSKQEDRPPVKWLTGEILNAKRIKRHFERKWRRTGSTLDRSRYRQSINSYNRLLTRAKQTFYTKTIEENSHDSKQLWKSLNSILHRIPTKILPTHNSTLNLANSLSTYFVDKIKKIRAGFPVITTVDSNNNDQVKCSHTLDKFQPVSEKELRKIIMASPTKSCALDPWPTHLVKENIETLLIPIKNVVNLSLSEGIFPGNFKNAIVTPLIKKPTLDKDELKNYRPVSGLNFISKIIERVVATQIKNHLVINKLDNKYQSAYKSGHSTETTLLKIKNDIHLNLAENKPTGLVLLDLSAAFDTIDHFTLEARLASDFGLNGTVLAWFKSYLAERSQSVKVGDVLSDPVSLEFGVPQGSVLGPVLFTLYTTPLSQIINKYDNISHHLYADDTQIYIKITPDNATTAIPTLQSCLTDIQSWMAENKLKLNPDKTEFIIFGSQKLQDKLKDLFPVNILGNMLSPTKKVRNLGVIFDSEFNFSSHISAVCKSCYYHMRDLARIRRHLPKSAAITLANALVSSRIDYCNSLLNSVSAAELNRLQRVQNSLARIVFKKPRYCQTTPLRKQLHWLPVEYRIKFKQSLLVYKTISSGSPAYFNDWITPYTCLANTRRSNPSNMLLHTSAFNRRKHRSTKHFDDAFSVCGPKLWNSLPLKVRLSKSVSSFRKELKSHFFDLAYPQYPT